MFCAAYGAAEAVPFPFGLGIEHETKAASFRLTA